MGGGFIKLHRKFLSWQRFSNDSDVKLFITCLLKANRKTGFFNNQKISAGQFITSLDRLADILGWNRKKVMRHLDALAQSGQIQVEKSPRGTLVTVVKWKDYQIKQQSHNGAADGTTNGAADGTTNGTLTRIYKESKEEKKRGMINGEYW